MVADGGTAKAGKEDPLGASDDRSSSRFSDMDIVESVEYNVAGTNLL